MNIWVKNSEGARAGIIRLYLQILCSDKIHKTSKWPTILYLNVFYSFY